MNEIRKERKKERQEKENREFPNVRNSLETTLRE